MARSDRNFDVVVILGGPDSALKRRTAQGIHLFEAGRAERILLSGGGGRRRIEADVMCEQALAAKVPRECLVLERDSHSTLQNALFSARIMRGEGWRTALVVTDSLHLPRALLAFRSAGVQVRGSAVPWPWCEAPFGEWLRYALYETIGIGWYLLLIVSGRYRRQAKPEAP